MLKTHICVGILSLILDPLPPRVKNMPHRLSLDRRVSGRVTKMRRILHVDTQHTRRKLLTQLEELFQISSNYARGVVKYVVDEKGKQRPLTVAERQSYTRIAAYTAQIIASIAKGLDERQIDKDLDQLEAMLKKTGAADAGACLDAGSRRESLGAPEKKLP